MLHFSKLRIFFVTIVTLIFILIASSNFIKSDNTFLNKKINLGLDLQGGSYLLLEIDNKPVELLKLQNTSTIIRNFFKNENINFTDLNIVNRSIQFNIDNKNIEKVKQLFLDKESEINPYGLISLSLSKNNCLTFSIFLLSILNCIDLLTIFKSVKLIFSFLKKFLIIVEVFCNFNNSTGLLSISNKRYEPPCKSRPRFIFLFKKVLSDFIKFDDAIKMKIRVTIVTKNILNFEKCNTRSCYYFFMSGAFINA